MRLLNACPRCGRQYDVSALEPGSALACACSATLTVEHRQPRAPRVLRCSNCGGCLREGASCCDYCSAEISLEERRLDSLCPRCFARMSSEARFCMECGVRIEVQPLEPLAGWRPCPGCAAPLRRRALGPRTSVVECARCAGLWLEPEPFARLCQDTEAQDMALRALGLARGSGERAQPRAAAPIRYLPCARCGQMMNRRNFGGSSGVVLDVCKTHGLWLEHGELERVLAFARAGGLERARVREFERVRTEREQRTSTPAGSWTASSTTDLDLGGLPVADLTSLLGWLGRAVVSALRRAG